MTAAIPPLEPHRQELLAPHGTYRGYAVGFGLSVLLTGAGFAIVMGHLFAHPAAAAGAVLVLAAAQIVVHMVFFLHMTPRMEGGWSLLALIFTLVLVTIMLTGSFWVMDHLNANMMPMSASDMRNMP
jgi:cytochrome o ubiquinol oxidase operon protein cyoD